MPRCFQDPMSIIALREPNGNEVAWRVFPTVARDRVHVAFDVVAGTSEKSAEDAQRLGLLSDHRAVVKQGNRWSETIHRNEMVQVVVIDDSLNKWEIGFSCEPDTLAHE